MRGGREHDTQKTFRANWVILILTIDLLKQAEQRLEICQNIVRKEPFFT